MTLKRLAMLLVCFKYLWENFVRGALARVPKKQARPTPNYQIKRWLNEERHS